VYVLFFSLLNRQKEIAIGVLFLKYLFKNIIYRKIATYFMLKSSFDIIYSKI